MLRSGAEPLVSVGLVAGGDLRRAAALEQQEIDSLWTGGHVASRHPSTEAMASLARLSAVTDRVRIGTATLLLPLYPPALVAKQVADLDRATGGRITLGVGVGGEYPQEFRACQVPVRERGARTDEAIGLLRRFWTGREISHDGPCYPLDAVRIHPAPIQAGGPPIVVAGRKEAAMRRAALLGDGWMPYLYSPERYARSVQTIRGLAVAAQRELADFGWYAFVFVNVGLDGDRARQEAGRRLAGMYAPNVTAMVDRVAAAGTAAQVTRRLCDFVDAGARHLILLPVCAADATDELTRRLLGEVVPAVREHAASPAGADQSSR